ncbi:MAG TPA: glycosyltransferase family 39 protein [Candidatus Dormibacteraeota bacterium]
MKVWATAQFRATDVAAAVIDHPAALAGAALEPPGRPHRLRRIVRGPQDDPRWARPALAGLLALTAILYLWDLGASGWANAFYSAAVQAGTKSWTAFFFGSSDASNFITVDKPPASLWVMEISARVFGVNAWSILVPQALEGVAAVALVYMTVRRWFTPAAGLLAGAVLALTPVAALMFRFNNPDALLTLLLTGAMYATVRALEGARTRWLVLAMTLVGFGFLTKMLQAFLVVPAILLVFLVAAPTPLRDRLRKLAIAGVALLVSAGWWVAIVQLVPAADRPYIGGSQDNSILNLIFGYNGFGRITGAESGSVGGGGAAGSRWGPTGWNRLFLADFGGQISWLLPGALILLGAGLWLTRRAPRTDRMRAAFFLWGGSLVVTCAVISYASGIIHPYYTVVMAPAVAALVGMGVTVLWKRRAQWFSRLALAGALAATAIWSYVLLGRSPDWYPALRTAVIVVGLAAAVALAAMPKVRGRMAAGIGAAGLCAALAGPAAYTVDTVLTPHSGAIPSAGPTLTSTLGGGPGGGFAGGAPNGFGGGGANPPAGGFGGAGLSPPTGFNGPPSANGGGAGAPGAPGVSTGGGPGGFLNASTPGRALRALLTASASHYTWAAAVVDSNSAAGYQLATGDPIMAIGGFNGTDPAPTLAEFEAYVQQGRVHYFIAGGGGAGGGGFGGFGGGGASTNASAITSWVAGHFTAQTVDGVTVYDLSQPQSTGAQ